jgi:hypothetical protein
MKSKLVIGGGLVFIIVGACFYSYPPTYNRMIDFMSAGVRQAFFKMTFAQHGVLSTESHQIKALGAIIKKTELIDEQGLSLFLPLVNQYPYERQGIMSLHIILDKNNKDLICSLIKIDGTRSAFYAKAKVYLENATRARAYSVRKTIQICSEQ